MTMLSRDAINALGFLSVGENPLISDRASFYGIGRIEIGDNVRIDDFCVLSAGVGGICIKNHVHIAVGSSLIGAGRIVLSDYCNISSRVSIFSSNDDYSGLTMTNPTVPSEYTSVTHADVNLGKHVIVGSGCVILPGVSLGEGVAVGALSLIKSNCEDFGVYVGNPARWIKERKRELLNIEEKWKLSKAV